MGQDVCPAIASRLQASSVPAGTGAPGVIASLGQRGGQERLDSRPGLRHSCLLPPPAASHRFHDKADHDTPSLPTRSMTQMPPGKPVLPELIAAIVCGQVIRREPIYPPKTPREVAAEQPNEANRQRC